MIIKKGLLAGSIIGGSIFLSGIAATMLTVSALGIKPLTAQDNIVRCEFLNEDDSLLYRADIERGTMPVYEGDTPKKASDKIYSYRFTGWDQELGKVYSDTAYHAQYTGEIRIYAATFVDGDNNLLFAQNFAAGSTPFYSGSLPQKAS